MNDVKVKLAYVSNPNMAQYEGCEGVLKQNNKGGWSFIMDNGKTISTSRIAPNTTLGDFNHPSCKEFPLRPQVVALMYLMCAIVKEHLTVVSKKIINFKPLILKNKSGVLKNNCP